MIISFVTVSATFGSMLGKLARVILLAQPEDRFVNFSLLEQRDIYLETTFKIVLTSFLKNKVWDAREALTCC